MNIDITPTIESTQRKISTLYSSQVPFATALALTRTAQTVQKLQVREMQKVFDRPTRFTLNSLRVRPAKKTNLEARVDFKDWIPKGTAPTKYLFAEIEGGTRNRKRSEQWMQNRRLIGSDEYLIPSKHARLNSFGNITAGRITKMLSNVGAQNDSAQNTSDSAKKLYFVATINGRKAVWERHGRKKRKIKPFMIIEDTTPRYRQRLDFHGLSERHAARLYPRKFQMALTQALSTAKK